MLTAVAAALGSTAQPELPGFLNSLTGPLEHYGLWAILLLVLVEDFGIPVPGETVLIAGAIFAGSGRLNIVAVGVVGFIAAVVGDNVGYAIGRFGGRRLVDRWGKYVFLTSERLDKAEAFFDRQGAKIITIARFIEGLRQANGIIAGLTEMHWLRFLIFNAVGAALWVGTWVSVGYFAGQHITTIYDAITTYSLYAAIAAVVLIAAWIGHRVYKRRKSAATRTQAGATASPAQAEAPAQAAPPEKTETAGQSGPPEKASSPEKPGAAAANGATGPDGTGAAHSETGGGPRAETAAGNGATGPDGTGTAPPGTGAAPPTETATGNGVTTLTGTGAAHPVAGTGSRAEAAASAGDTGDTGDTGASDGARPGRRRP